MTEYNGIETMMIRRDMNERLASMSKGTTQKKFESSQRYYDFEIERTMRIK